nr:hypothetical protein Iba_chr05cCG11370 [Ipomoea batatas]
MAESQANFPQARSNTLTSKEKDTEGASVEGMWVCVALEATHMRVLDLQSKGDIEVAVEPETPDLEGEVKSTVLDGSTIPTALKRAICLEGSVTEDVTPTRALSRLLRKSSTGEVIGASRGVRMAKSEML